MSIVLEPYQVIIRPLVTEKGTYLSESRHQYQFEVNPAATKADIKKAIQVLWNVRVLDVRTQVYKGKPRRWKMRLGRTQDWKKAIVKLHAEDNIAFF
ncbi:MAG: 50S ribosomal protein L23 [Planctomycetota bacterium]|nr:MAG: 50S ribosomal protein L23 [Planctomycetota bacterium]